MYSFVVIYKVKLHMHALHIFMVLCRIYQDVVISAQVGAVIMELLKKTNS